MTALRLLFAALLALAGLGLLPARAEAQLTEDNAPFIAGIEVSGTVRVEAEAIYRQVALRAGMRLTSRSLGEAVRAVYAMGFFDDVSVDAQPQGDGILLRFILVERPTISSVEIEGEDAIEESEMIEKLALPKGTILNQQSIAAGVTTIEEMYREKGFFLASVESRIETRAVGEVVVKYVITEAEKVRIARLTLIGNEALSDEEIQQFIETRPETYLSFMSGLGSFKEASLDLDLQRIRVLYYDRGFLDVRVSKPTVSLSRDRSRVYISVPIDEGKAYSVSTLSASGDLLEEPGKLLKGSKIVPGENFSSSSVRVDLARITRSYKDRGYANANVNLMTRMDAENHQVSVTYEVDRGEVCFIGTIEVSGNDLTRDRVVRRELAIEEGDQYSSSEIERSVAYVKRLGFFEDVTYEEEPSSTDPRIVNLKILVKERSTRSLQAGAGFSSGESLFFMAQISENNLFGRGQSLTLNTTLSSLRKLFVLSFVEQRVFDSKWQFGADLFQRTIQYPQFTRESRGFALNVGVRPFDESPMFRDLAFNLGYRLEDVSIDRASISGSVAGSTLSLYRSGITSGVNGTVTWDKRNDQYMPSAGFYQQVYTEVAPSALGSANEFWLTRGISRWYARPFAFDCPGEEQGGGVTGTLCRWFSSAVLKLNGTISRVGSLSPEKPVPISERFFEGGPNGVRGFERLSLGPRQGCANADPYAARSTCPVGGVKSLVFNGELEFPILSAVGLRGVMFADAGNAFDADQPYSFQLDFLEGDANAAVLRSAWGFGIRWQSPIGPLRFEWGNAAAPRAGELDQVFEFSIGNSF